MEAIANIIRGVKRNAKIIDEEFSGIFALSGEELDEYEGRFEDVALAHAVLRLKRKGYICPSCKSELFASLRKAIVDAEENFKKMQPLNNGDNQDEGENENSDTGDKCG